MPRRESESSDSFFITPEAYKATEAVEFIAEHLRNEDEYIQVGGLAGLSHNYILYRSVTGWVESVSWVGNGWDGMGFSQVSRFVIG